MRRATLYVETRRQCIHRDSKWFIWGDTRGNLERLSNVQELSISNNVGLAETTPSTFTNINNSNGDGTTTPTLPFYLQDLQVFRLTNTCITDGLELIYCNNDTSSSNPLPTIEADCGSSNSIIVDDEGTDENIFVDDAEIERTCCSLCCIDGQNCVWEHEHIW